MLFAGVMGTDMKISMIAGAAFAAAVLSAGAASATTFATQIDVGRADVAGVGFEAESPVFNTNRDDAGNALGAPDQAGNSEGGFFSLGRDAVAVFGFGTSFGIDATIFEVTFNCNGPQNPGGSCNFNESVDVYVFNGAYTPFDTSFGLSDLTSLGFTYAASVPNGLANQTGGATVAIGGPFSFLALVDTSLQAGDGFDVDAVSVSAVPVPASILFLVSALGGIGFLRARRAA
ncbi:MAG: VPLPA-CTERM sorting domain-containing protein [Paracoccaceae bacterium]